MAKDMKDRPPRAGRGGHGRSKYNDRGENLERVLVRQQGRRYAWLLRQLTCSRPTLYRARLPESDPLYMNVSDEFWINIAKVLRVHPSELLGTRAKAA